MQTYRVQVSNLLARASKFDRSDLAGATLLGVTMAWIDSMPGAKWHKTVLPDGRVTDTAP